MTTGIDRAARAWLRASLDLLEADSRRGAETMLRVFPLPPEWNINLYLKDESNQLTGSLKHRLARSLFTYGLVSGKIGPGTTIVEASSGSTAISEAYFARLLGLNFITVVPASTSKDKIAEIERFGGRCHLVESSADITPMARQLCLEADGYFMDQFTNAAHATDWRQDNIAESILHQLQDERFPVPSWIVVGVGTGGTSTTTGRYLRYRGLESGVAIADPEGSAYFKFWAEGGDPVASGSRIEGIGRPTVEPSFIPSVVDRAMHIPDALSIAALRVLEKRMGIQAGGSTGTNLAAALAIVAQMRAAGETGSVVTLICDAGSRYRGSYYDHSWISAAGLNVERALLALDAILDGRVADLSAVGLVIATEPHISLAERELSSTTAL